MGYAADEYDFIAKRQKEIKEQITDSLKATPLPEEDEEIEEEQEYAKRQLDWFERAIMGTPYKK